MPIELSADERELLHEEVRDFLALLSDDARPRYRALVSAVEEGVLPDDALAPVGDLLEVGLQTGRIRKLHRAPGEQTLLRLFGKTPAGKAQAEAAADVNRALGHLAGQEIESLRLLARVPGTYLLHIGTASCEITLRLGPDGAAVESVALGV